ncbi:putative Ser/Thr protein kinase [Cryptosporidium canis]|uniref:Ser/Thr protein kinase n=1 Tax=Cryptosporidium canis TaxID=195482 RepID=A0ABQ8PBD4_9CRYT|nr:putative Ser/Thr protein kinase [Cryptosporidium canis]
MHEISENNNEQLKRIKTMQANQIVELRALHSLREIYEDCQVIKLHLKTPKYVSLMSKLDGYKNPYFFENELECWEGKDCTISGKFKFSASEGIQVIKESICLYPKAESIMVFITKYPKEYSHKENNVGIRLIERQHLMLKASIRFFEQFGMKRSYECPLSPTNCNVGNSLYQQTNWKTIRIFWFDECNIVGREGTYMTLGVEMPLRRTLTSIMTPGIRFDLKVLAETKLNHLIGLINLIIKYISLIRSLLCHSSYLPIFLSTDSILLDIEKSIEESIININEITITDIGENLCTDTIEYSTNGHMENLLPIFNIYNYNKYLSPEIAISHFIELSLRNIRENKIVGLNELQTIYDGFDTEILKKTLNERLKNKWQPLILSGDILFQDKDKSVQRILNHSGNIVDMIAEKELNLIVKIGVPSIVFSLGLLISQIFGGKDLLVSCDNDILHSVDCLCEWNSCGNYMPLIGRVKEENVMNSLTGRRNQSVEDIIPEFYPEFAQYPQFSQLNNKIQKLLWGCLNFIPSQRLTLSQVEYELRRISDDFSFICQQKENVLDTQTNSRAKCLRKLKSISKKIIKSS